MDEAQLAQHIRAALAGVEAIREVRMFGGLAFLLNGNMMASASKRGLMARVGPDGVAAALAHPGTIALEMRGKPMPGFVRVTPPALGTPAVDACLQQALAFVRTLPPKSEPAAPKRRPSGRPPVTSRRSS